MSDMDLNLKKNNNNKTLDLEILEFLNDFFFNEIWQKVKFSLSHSGQC